MRYGQTSRNKYNRLHTSYRELEKQFTLKQESSVKEQVGYYMNNAKESLTDYRMQDTQYLVVLICAIHLVKKTPDNMTSWNSSIICLEDANVVGTPGSGSPDQGEDTSIDRLRVRQ